MYIELTTKMIDEKSLLKLIFKLCSVSSNLASKQRRKLGRFVINSKFNVNLFRDEHVELDIVVV